MRKKTLASKEISWQSIKRDFWGSVQSDGEEEKEHYLGKMSIS